MHELQTTFATAAGEAAWNGRLRSLVERGNLEQAEAILVAALSGMDSDVARLCHATTPQSVEIDGMDELAESVRLLEGAPVTGFTLALGNDLDLAFEKGQLHTPHVMFAAYTDEQWNWSSASRAELIEQCNAEEPEFAGTDEDIEAYLDISGLAALNTALIHHKQRHFIRETEPEQAPLRYVDFVLGTWWRAVRFHRAAEAVIRELPKGITFLSGMAELRPDTVCVHRTGSPMAQAAPAPNVNAAAELQPDLSARDLIRRTDFVEEEPASTGGALRQRLSGDASAPAPMAAATPAKPEVVAIAGAIQMEEEAPVEVEDVFAPEPVVPVEVAEVYEEEPPRRGFLARLFRRR